MPELILRDLVIDKLKDSDFNSQRLLKRKSASYFLKSYVTSLDDDVVMLDDNLFEVSIDVNDYNEIIYTETYYGLTRILRQFDAMLALAGSPGVPKAWLLVTTYYHSFFCANLITRLLGRYSCYFAQNEIAAITATASNPVRKQLSVGNYVGSYHVNDGNSVKIRFRNEGERPHHTAWKNLCDKFRSSGFDGNSARENRIKLFKQIINSSSNGWQIPSEIRNTWNYTDVLLYTAKGDTIASELCSVIGNHRDIEWASRNKLQPDEKNIATSIAYISATLNRSIESLKSKILG